VQAFQFEGPTRVQNLAFCADFGGLIVVRATEFGYQGRAESSHDRWGRNIRTTEVHWVAHRPSETVLRFLSPSGMSIQKRPYADDRGFHLPC
jgi:hypothetical protein